MQSNDNTYLMIAIKNNNTELAKALIDDGADINIQDNDGNNAFLEDAFDGHTETTKLLIDNGADLNIQNKYGWTALMCSAFNGHTETAKLLIDNGAGINIQDGFGETALIKAAMRGYPETAKLLIDNGADINIQDINGSTALIKAAQGSHTETASLLIDNGADINIQDLNGSTALIEAANYRYTETIATLLDRGADLPDDKSKIISTMKKESWWTPMHAAIINNLLDQIQIFEYSESDITPLDLAIMTGNLDAVRALIGLGIQYDINACLKTAVIAKRNELARFFLENGANPSSNNKLGQNTFHIAASTNNHTIIRTLHEFYRKNNAAKLIQNNFRLSLFHSKERNVLMDEIGQNIKSMRIS